MGGFEFEYIRHGTTRLMGLFELKTRKVFDMCNPRRTTDDTLGFMEMMTDFTGVMVTLFGTVSVLIQEINEPIFSINMGIESILNILSFMHH